MTLALFDFDKTLTTKDSLLEFLKYTTSTLPYLIKMLKFTPFFIAYKLNIIKNYDAKERLFKIFFKDFNETKFKAIAKEFSLCNLDKILNYEIYQKLKTHIQRGDKVVIVSASMECWLKPWCDKHNIDLLSTKLEFKEQKLTGKFFTKNCHGKEKVSRINKHLTLSDYDDIYAYGDSSGDDEMLAIATHKVRVK